MTGDEMHRAIEFLLRSQANFEMRFEESNQNWNLRFEQANRRLAEIFERSDQRWESRFEESKRSWKAHLDESNRKCESRFEESNRVCIARFEETNRQIAQTNMQIGALVETQAAFTQTMLHFMTLQTEFNAWVRQKLCDLAEGLERTRKELSELTTAVNNLVRFSSVNGNAPPE